MTSKPYLDKIVMSPNESDIINAPWMGDCSDDSILGDVKACLDGQNNPWCWQHFRAEIDKRMRERCGVDDRDLLRGLI